MKSTTAIDDRLARIEQRLDALEARAFDENEAPDASGPGDRLPTDRAALEAKLDEVREQLDGAIQTHARAVDYFHAWGDVNGAADRVRASYALRRDIEALEIQIVDRLGLYA